MQNINLFLQLPKKPKVLLTLKTTLIIYAFFCAWLLISTFTDAVSNHKKESQIISLRLALEKENKSLQLVQKKYPMINISDLEGSTQKIQQELTANSELFGVLTRKIQLSSYLLSLANTIINGVWLTHISIEEGGHLINIKGLTFNAALANEFLDQLRHQSVFAKIELKLLGLSHTPPDNKAPLNAIHFEIAGKVEKIA